MVAFYNQGDQDIYNQGIKFRPQQKYLLDDYTAPTAQIKPVPGGITNTNAFTNSGGNDFSVYNPDPNSIVNKNYNPYLSRNAAENSYLPGRSNATDPRYSSEINNMGIKRAQSQYNLANNNMTASGPMTPERQAEVLRTRNNLIQDNRQNYGAQGQFETVDSPLAYSSETELNKFKDNYPEYYNKPKPTGLARLAELAGGLIPGAGIARFIGDYLPVNRRSILENELSGQGVMVNDIGQIVQGDGAYDTAGNVMAGYNANKLTAESFDKRIAMAKEKMSAENKGARIKALEEAKANFLNAQGKTDLVFEDKEAEKKKKKKKGNIITRFLNKKKETKAAANAQAAADAQAAAVATGGGARDFDPSGPTQKSIRDSRPDKSGAGQSGGFTNPGKGSYGPHMANGGRAGYFFGGRVNFKDGGLAGIL